MNWILVVLTGFMLLCLLSIALIAIFNPIVFKMALRNPPRRKAQSILIIFGLMLATLIVSSALTTGDTLDHTITKITYDTLGPIDQTIAFVGEGGGNGTLSTSSEPIPASLADDLATRFEGDPDIQAFMPMLTVDVPAISFERQLSEPSVVLAGLDFERVQAVGGIQQPNGAQIDLSQVQPGSAILSETLADDLDAVVGDTITVVVNSQPTEVTVAAIGRDSILTGISFGFEGPTNHGLAMALSEVQQLTGLEGMARFIAVTNHGGIQGAVDHSEAASDKLEATLESLGAVNGFEGDQLGVNPVKAQSVAAAEFAGSLFTSLFLVLGLFSISAGILLIFLIFLMLAAERRSEMGMSRAVGMRQSHLVQQFLAEGTLYDLGSALVGAILGVGVAFIMVGIINQVIGEFLTISPTWSPRSIAVAYTLGVTITFITVIFASLRAARLNIVAAIRDLPDLGDDMRTRPRWIWWRKLPRFGPQLWNGGLYAISLLWFPLELLPNLLIYPVRVVIWMVRIIAHYVGWGPLLVPIGVLFMLWGWQRADHSWSLAIYSIGLSLFGLGLMLILSKWLPQRIVFTAISLILLFWWLSPTEGVWGDIVGVFTPNNLTGDFEMFFISGIMMVTFATLLIMWNAEIIVWIVSLFGRAFSRWLPAVKTAVAYPLASKTKTGLTLAMFALIMFSLVTMSTLNANFIELFTTDEATAGWDIEVATSPNNPIEDFRGALEGSAVDLNEFRAIGGMVLIDYENSEIRLPDDVEADGSPDWKRHELRGVDDEFALNTAMPLKVKAAGYETDAEIWEAIANDPTLAVVDAFTAGPGDFGADPDGFRVSDVDPSEPVMQPTEAIIRDPSTGTEQTITIIGVIDDKISTAFGVYMGEQALLDVYGTPDGQLRYISLTDKSVEHAKDVAKQIEQALFEYGVQAESTQEQLRVQAQLNTGFLDLIQGFMGLGLLVGIAALGVISFRAVVERRQQIGMLRAIGFQRNMVAASFLLEAMTVAVLGILAGLTLGLILSHNLISSPEFNGGSDFTGFVIPWQQLTIMITIALVAAAVMTIVPSRKAASVPVAEALRYE
jgi:putative ABC transport system permease protein